MVYRVINMKPTCLFLGLITIAVGCCIASTNQLTKTDAIKPLTAHGYFKCKSGTLEIVGAGGNFNVFSEQSETYQLEVTFAYKPMSGTDVEYLEKTGKKPFNLNHTHPIAV